MTDNNLKKAIIYTRVASTPANSRNAVIDGQEKRCREYAALQGHDVVAAFPDAAPGTIASRPGLKQMFRFLDERRTEPFAVIVDDVSVLAREMSVYTELRYAIGERGATLKTRSRKFGEGPEKNLVEDLCIAIAQDDAEVSRSREELQDAGDATNKGTGLE
ncbi:MAG: recombinase family protein [Rhizobiaceae bacterium]|nr:recombinase family protein [Rhizobiaceae bacterium]